MHATFIQKVLICVVAGFAAACLIQWAKVFVEGADKALNGGYEHRTVMGTEKKAAVNHFIMLRHCFKQESRCRKLISHFSPPTTCLMRIATLSQLAKLRR